MKKNDIQKIKEKGDVELAKELALTQEEVRSLRFDVSSGKLKNYNQLREAKRKVARIMTFMKLRGAESSEADNPPSPRLRRVLASHSSAGLRPRLSAKEDKIEEK